MTDTPLQATISLRGVVIQDEEVLLGKRETDGGWELPGGRLGAHEDTVPGLRREIAEETDLDVTVEETVHAISWRNDTDDGRFAVYYRCPATDDGVTLSAEHQASAWVDPAEAIARLSTPQGQAVREAIEARPRASN